MRSKRKYIAILILALAAMLCMVGASMWIVTSPTSISPKWAKLTPVYFKRVVEYDYTDGGISLTEKAPEIAATVKNSALDANGDSVDASAISSVAFKTDVTASNGDAVNSVSKITVGSTYSLSNLTVTLNDGYYFAGTYLDSPATDKSEDIKDTPTTYSFSPVLKYKTVQIGTGGKESTSSNSVNVSFTPKQSAWYTIEDALRAANTGSNKVVRPAGSASESYTTDDAIITSFTALEDKFTGYDSTCRTINADVTLLLPYDGENNHIYNELSDSLSQVLGNSKYKNLELRIPKNTSIINKGTISIGGETTGYQEVAHGVGHTARRYAQIVLGPGAAITSDGKISAWGFITEDTQNNGSKVNLESGSLYMPIWIKEHRGGSVTYGMGEHPEGSPFNRYYMQNITSLLTVKNTANVYGRAYFFINTGSIHASKDVNFIGNSTSYFFQLVNNNSYIKWKYSINSGTVDGEEMSSETMKIDTYGNVNLNPISIQITVNIVITDVSRTIHTDKAAMPIPWHLNITFHPAENGSDTQIDATKQDIKLLPGAKVKIDAGVAVKANQVVVHDKSWVDPALTYTNYPYPSTEKGDAQLIVNGTLDAVKLGGDIKTEQNNAQLIVQENSAASYEPSSSSGSATSTEVFYRQDTKMLSGNAYIKGEIQSSELSAGTYSSKMFEGVGVWRTKAYPSVSYHANGGVFANGKDTNDVLYSDSEFNDWQSEKKDLTYERISHAAMPTRAYYDFLGWATSPDATADKVIKEGESTQIIVGGQNDLYAIWKPIEYTFKYHIAGIPGVTEELEGEITTWDVESDEFDLVSFMPEGFTVPDGYVFDGWYLKNDFTENREKIGPDTIGSFLTYGDNTTIVLYARLEEYFEASVKYVIEVPTDEQSNEQTFRETYANGMGNSERSIIKGGEAFDDLPEINSTVNDEDSTLKYYFLGWKTINGDNVTNITTAASNMVKDGVIIITAKWAKKAHVTIGDEVVTEVRYEGYYKPGTPINVKEKVDEDALHKWDYDVTKNVTYFTGNWTTNVDNKVQSDGSFIVPEGDANGNGAEINIQSERKAKVTLTVKVSANAGTHTLKKSSCTASCKITIAHGDNNDYTNSLTVTDESEQWYIWHMSGDATENSVTLYLKPGQKYSINVTAGETKDGVEATAEEGKNLNVTVSNNL